MNYTREDLARAIYGRLDGAHFYGAEVSVTQSKYNKEWYVSTRDGECALIYSDGMVSAGTALFEAWIQERMGWSATPR